MMKNVEMSIIDGMMLVDSCGSVWWWIKMIMDYLWWRIVGMTVLLLFKHILPEETVNNHFSLRVWIHYIITDLKCITYQSMRNLR